ncbi:K02A2.6-like [Cordylochernes scorpioides]|uniref:Flavin-containing monooxygenase n=1 Tax=Cordylochernes scorpioides TaxID=51811 RepID=A0ABY6KMY0_9ARAC|nr:K02A2.6-like [Cordylochernes scorpioides]
MLNEMLRDKLVVGVRSENLQKRLLQEGDDATLDKIYEIALSYEAAERDLLSMKNVDYADANVHDVKKLNSACSHCGRHNHLSNKCFFKNAKCHECGKIGHIKPACKNRKTKYAKIQHGSKATEKINVVEARKNGKYFITLNVDNKNIQFEFDTDQILIAYDPKLPIRLSCDSSSYGLGAVMSQIDVDGNERPIYFISRTLSQAEKKYSQIDKECLSIIWALKKFNNYLFGRKFELITDNKPLHHILNPKREITSNMSARLQRWALILSSYNFTIECRKTGDHGNADGLSRLPLKQYEEMEEDAVNTVHMIKQCEELPLTSSHIRRESFKDSILKIVYQNTLYGWKDKPSNTELLSFYLRREELTVEQGILLLGTRVVIPMKFRAKIKAELHQGHLGVVKIENLARNFIWWPGIDREIEEITRVCRECNINNHTLKQESVHRWESAPTPWYRVHLDFAGPFMNKMFLIVIDSYSKWPEVIIMNSSTAVNTIRVLRDLFSRYGIPDQVVTDNGPQFVILSTRRGFWLSPRVSAFGLPSDINYLTRFMNFVFNILPWNISNSGMEAICNLRIDHEAYGLKPKHRYLAQHPTLNDALPDRILSGHIRIKGNIKEFTENGIIFENETTETLVDDVVLCTGYKVKFPFLDFKFENNKVELYKMIFPPDDPHPSLSFIGLFQPLGPGFPAGELQCRWVTRILSGKSTLPPKHIMWADIKEFVEQTKKIFGPSPCHTLHVYYINYLDEIANIIGCKPNFFKMFFTDPILFFYCVFGPCLPYQFRLSGPGAWKGARDAILTYKKRIYAPLKSSRITKKNESCCSKNIYKIFLMALPILVYLVWFEYF